MIRKYTSFSFFALFMITILPIGIKIFHLKSKDTDIFLISSPFLEWPRTIFNGKIKHELVLTKDEEINVHILNLILKAKNPDIIVLYNLGNNNIRSIFKVTNRKIFIINDAHEE